MFVSRLCQKQSDQASRQNYLLINYSWGVHATSALWYISLLLADAVIFVNVIIVVLGSVIMSTSSTALLWHLLLSSWLLNVPFSPLASIQAKSKGWLGFSLTSETYPKLAEDAIWTHMLLHRFALMLQTLTNHSHSHFSYYSIFNIDKQCLCLSSVLAKTWSSYGLTGRTASAGPECLSYVQHNPISRLSSPPPPSPTL